MKSYTHLLTKQIKRYLKESEAITPEWEDLLDAINRSYEHYESNRILANRSSEISSSEVRELIEDQKNKEEIFRQFSENSSDVFWMLSADMNEVIYLSPNLKKNLEISDLQLPPSFRDWCQLIHPQDRENYIQLWKSISTITSFVEMDYRLQIQDKQTIWIRDRAFPVKNEQGVVYRIGGIARNITSFKKSGLLKDIQHALIILLEKHTNLEQIAPQIIEKICRLAGWKIGIFLQMNPDTNELACLGSWYQNEEAEAFAKSLSSLKFAQESALVGKIVAQHGVLLVRGTENVSLLHHEMANTNVPEGAIGFPIYLKESCYGIVIFFDNMKEIDDMWLQLFHEISHGISLFIERQHTEQALISSEERFRNIFEYAALGLALVSPEGIFLQVNPSLCEMLGFSSQELLGKNIKEITWREDLVKENTYQLQLLAGQSTSFQSERRFITKNQHYIWTSTSCSLIKDPQNKPIYFIYEIKDISLRKHTEEKLFNLAYYDLLTTLPNRRLVEDNLNQALLTASLKNEKVVLFLIKLNHFSRIKDTIDPTTADIILKQMALRLVDKIKIKDIVGRWGEDEFVILLSQVINEESPLLLAKKILQIVKESFIIEDRRYFFTASVGVSVFPEDGNQPQLLLKNAYMAMNRANFEGNDNIQFYTAEMLKESQEKMVLETQLRQAISQKELFLNFQPTIDDEGRVCSIELLLRWNSKQLGLVPPTRFIPLAEETGLILPIGEWLFMEGCKLLKALEKEGLPTFIFAINISALQFRDPNFLTYIDKTLKETEVDGQLLRFEIVETQLMENMKESIEILRSLRKQKIQIAIDDFGIGYSSFNYLRQFEIDRFKIDISFIHNIDKEPKNAGIVNAILAMSKALGIPSIAEGVETKEEFDLLMKLGCKEFQGYYLSYPLSFEQLKEFLLKKQKYAIP